MAIQERILSAAPLLQKIYHLSVTTILMLIAITLVFKVISLSDQYLETYKERSHRLNRGLGVLAISLGAVAALPIMMYFGLFYRGDYKIVHKIYRDDNEPGHMKPIFVIGKGYDIQRGDLVIAQKEGGQEALKRVIGLGGDEIYMPEIGGVFVNWQMLDETSYLDPHFEGFSGIEFYTVVPQEQLFLLSDYRFNAHDSRAYGGYLAGEIKAKVILDVDQGQGILMNFLHKIKMDKTQGDGIIFGQELGSLLGVIWLVLMILYLAIMSSPFGVFVCAMGYAADEYYDQEALAIKGFIPSALAAISMIVVIRLMMSISISTVTGMSMAPAAPQGSVQIVQTKGYGLKRGDMITIDARDEVGQTLIKRLIATSGDHVYVASEGGVLVNGVELDESAYIPPDLMNGDGVDLVVPLGEFFFLGDNRPVSNDSRGLGTFSLDKIKGKVVIDLRPMQDYFVKKRP